MSILIVGSEGSMGKRYQAILRFLGRKFECADKDTTLADIHAAAKRADGVIVCTPTDTHADYIRALTSLGKPVLCEKPITKNMEELRSLFKGLEQYKTPFRMMFQYDVLAERDRIGPTRYNYFRHGNDGLIWDCLQIIGLARSTVELKEDNPVWTCMINGKTLHSSHMDAAYIAYVQKWFQHPRQDLGRLLQIHERTAQAAKVVLDGGNDNGVHRGTGALH